jgi:hypothetical protein
MARCSEIGSSASLTGIEEGGKEEAISSRRG